MPAYVRRITKRDLVIKCGKKKVQAQRSTYKL